MGALICFVLLAVQDTPDPSRRGSVLEDVNLHDLTRHVQKVTRKTILWTDDQALKNKRVFYVTDRPIGDDPDLLFKAYQHILQASDLLLVPAGKEGEEVYKVALLPHSLKKALPVVRGAAAEPGEKFITRIFTLQHASPRVLWPVLSTMASTPQNVQHVEESGIILVTDYDSNLRRMEDIIRALDVKKPDLEFRTVALKFASATKVEEKMNLLVQTLISRSAGARAAGVPGVPGNEPAKVVSDERTNSIILLAEPGRLVQLEEIARKLDAETPFETSGIHIARLLHRNAMDVARTLNAIYRGGTIDERATGVTVPQRTPPPSGAPLAPSLPSNPAPGTEPIIVPDPGTNSLLVITDRTTFRSLEPIIRRLDRRLPQVYLKATVVEISANESFDLGVELARLENPKGRFVIGGRTAFGLSGVNADPAANTFTITPVASPGATLLGMKDRIGNIPALLHALKGRGKVTILDEPEAITSDNSATTMKAMTEIPLPSTTLAGAGGFSQSSFNYQPAETTLIISPHTSERGYVRLDIQVIIQKFGASTDPQLPPPRSSRELRTKEVLVPSGGTMVLGGIVTADESNTVQSVPFLGDIPLLGSLFRREQQTQDRRTLYIFVTPTILYDESFGDYRELTQDRKNGIEALRGAPIHGLQVGPPSPKLPDSTFRFLSIPTARPRAK